MVQLTLPQSKNKSIAINGSVSINAEPKQRGVTSEDRPGVPNKSNSKGPQA